MKIFYSIITMFLMFASTTHAKDFETSQHNFKLKSGNYGIEFREERNLSKDHVQLTYYGVDDLAIDYRHVHNSEKVENRFRATYKLYDNGTFFIKPRVEYRMFNGGYDYWRLRSIIGARVSVTDNVTTWIDTQTSWNFGEGQDNNSKINSNQARVGLDYSLSNNATIGTFVQYETDENWNKTGLFLGTALSIKL